MSKNELEQKMNTEKDMQVLCDTFFEKIATFENYDYIIFVARRCFNIYKVYNCIKHLDYKANVFSSRAIDIIGNDFFEKRVLICDDVLIHGKALYKLKNKILKYNPKCIDIRVIIQKYDGYDIANKILKLNAKCEKLSSEHQWKEESKQIMKLIQTIPRANVSYVLDGNLTIDQNLVSHVISTISKTDFDSKYLNIKIGTSYYIFQKNTEYNSLVDFSVLRIYTNETDSITTDKINLSVVPYIQLKSLSENNINYIWERICKDAISICSNNEKNNILIKKIQSLSDKFRAITTIFSVLLWKNELNKFFNIKINWDYSNLDKSYFDGFSQIFIDPIFNQNIYTDLYNDEISIDDTKVELSENRYEDILKETNSWYNRRFDIVPAGNSNNINFEKFINSIIDQYIQVVSDREESEFCKFIAQNSQEIYSNEQYLSYCYNGISFERFIEFMLNFTKNEFINRCDSNTICIQLRSDFYIRNLLIAYTINKLDLGYISLNTIISDNNLGFYSFKTGEASWELVFKNHQEVFWPLVKAFDFSQRLKHSALFENGSQLYFEQIYNEYSKSELNNIIPVEYLKNVLNMFESGIPFDVHVYDQYRFSYKHQKQEIFVTKLFEIIKKVTKKYIDEKE